MDSAYEFDETELSDLVESPWDEDAPNLDEMPIPDWIIEEVDRRRVELLKNPGLALTWDEVKRNIRNRNYA